MYAEQTAGSKSDSELSDCPVDIKRKKRAASTDNSTPKCKKLKSEKNKRKKRHLSSESSSSNESSESCSSSSSDERRKKRKRKKHKKEKKRKLKKDKKKKKKKSKKHNEKFKEDGLIGPVLPEDSAVKSCSVDTITQNPSKSMAPMTKEEWEKRQSVVRRVFDEETGRYRLIKGDGEVLEEIVSRERHREINKQSTLGDGAFFQARLSSIHHK